MFKKCWVTATPGAPKNVHNNEKTHLSMQLFVENDGIVFKVEGWKCHVFAKSKWKIPKKTSIGKPQKKKINHPVCQPPRNTNLFLEVFPPHAAQGNFPTSWMEALTVKELWGPDKGENENTTSPGSRNSSPRNSLLFFLPTHQPGFFFLGFYLGGQICGLFLVAPCCPNIFESPCFQTWGERAMLGGRYFGYPIWKNLQMLQFSPLKLSLFIRWSQILIHHFPWWDFSLI